MTYRALPKASIKVDVLQYSSLTSVSNGSIFLLNDTIRNTTATIDSSNYLVLHSNSSWRIEVNAMCQFSKANTTYYAEFYWYDGSQNLGTKGRTSNIALTEIGRPSACLFLPASAISGTITVYPRIQTVVGGPTYDGTYTVPPHCRILELPN